MLLQVTNPMPPEDRSEMLDALTTINHRWIAAIDDYHFPVVTLSEQVEADALCTIFETLNRTGVKSSGSRACSAVAVITSPVRAPAPGARSPRSRQRDQDPSMPRPSVVFLLTPLP